MSDPFPAGRPTAPSAVRTPVLALGSVAVCGVAGAGLALGAPRDARSWVLAVAVAYGVLLVAAVVWAGVAARRTRESRARAAAFDTERRELQGRVAQLQAHADSHQRRLEQMALGAEATGAELATARAETEQLRTHLEELGADTSRLVEEAIPAAVKQLTAGASAGTALAGTPTLAEPQNQRVLEVFTSELAAGERLRAATLAACANAAGRVQAMTTTMLADLRDMEDRADEDVLGDLLRLDHATAQTGRLADSIAVLTGGRSGRRWTRPIRMESILRGAISRISAYQRVRLHSTSTVAVVGHAAEGVMHALAELVDNATKFSPPTEAVHVYVEELTTGVMITVEDAGLVMSPQALHRAQHAVSNDPLNLGTLSGTRLGLAVVGGLARKHGLSVNFRPSSRGGTGVLLLIPQQLITRPQEGDLFAEARQRAAQPTAGTAADLPRTGTATRADAGSRPQPEADPEIGPAGLPMRQGGGRSVPAPAAPGDEDELAPRPGTAAEPVSGAADDDVFVLPKRVRGRTLAAADHPETAQAPVAPQPPTGNLGLRFGAFVAASKAQQATRGGAPEQPSEDAPTAQQARPLPPDLSTPDGDSAPDSDSAPDGASTP